MVDQHKHIDFCILGAGLAGISLAHELSERGASLCVVDPNGIGGGASGTPIGLVNPAGGRFASLSWRAEQCYPSILSNLRLVSEKSGTSFHTNNGVLRPALDEEIAAKMHTNYEEKDWPQNWISWLTEEEMKRFHPGISCIGGGVWLPVGLTVNIPNYLSNFAKLLMENEVSFQTEKAYTISKVDKAWKLAFTNGSSISAKHVVFCTGSSIINEKDWSYLPVHPVKGQLALFTSNNSLSFKHAISALGYIASLSDKEFVVGSTYEHKFDHPDPDKQGLEYLFNRFSKVLPELAANSTLTGSWSGIRLSTPNRKPVLGHHKTQENYSVFCGLASKGLLYSAYLAKLMADFLLEGNKLPEEVSIERFYK